MKTELSGNSRISSHNCQQNLNETTVLPNTCCPNGEASDSLRDFGLEPAGKPGACSQMFGKWRKGLRLPFFAIIFSGLIVMLGAFGTRNFELVKSLDVFAGVVRELHIQYVEEIDPMALVQTAIEAMLETLDPYTNFIPADQIEEVRFMTTGQYGGIGALITKRDEFVLVSEPFEGTPAHVAGLRAGDIIMEVDGESVHNFSSDQVSERLKGQPGTTIQLTISRYGYPESLIIPITRRIVTINNVTYSTVLDNDIAYILVTGFTQNAGREVREAFLELRRNRDLNGVIIDLRGNGGGLMNEAVNIINLFVERNLLIVSTKGRTAERTVHHRTLNDPIDTLIPLAVLIDRGSASASEIVAGAVQDLDRGIIIGQRSFGKGLVQNVVPLSYNTQLKVTVAKYFIPSGRSIQAIDYATRNADGSLAPIPDSLKTQFKTRRGRLVYDGGGIQPDITTPPFTLSNVSRALLNNFLIFDYATRFFSQNPELGLVSNFKITDAIYNDFVSFLADKEYHYVTESERLLLQFREAAGAERYFASVADEFNTLKNKILRNKEEDLILFREEVSMLLKEEILSRYYFQRGRAKANLDSDGDILQAISLLTNSEAYRRQLSGR